jgi:hypothetical protein
VTQDLLTDRIDFVEVEGGGMSGPDSQHSGASAGFEHASSGWMSAKSAASQARPNGVEKC